MFRASLHTAWVLALAALLLVAACTKPERFEVLQTLELDRIPVLIRLEAPVGGLEKGQFAVALIGAVPYQTKAVRTTADIVALYQPRNRTWRPLGPGHAKRVPATSYLLETPVGAQLESVHLEKRLNTRFSLNPQEMGAAMWLRIAHASDDVLLEVAFDTEPMTIHKVSYRPEIEGRRLLLLTGATLQVKPRK